MYWLKITIAILILLYTLFALFLSLFILDFYLSGWSTAAKMAVALVLGIVWVVPIGFGFSLIKRLKR